MQTPVFEANEMISFNPNFKHNNIRLDLVPKIKKKEQEVEVHEGDALKITYDRNIVIQVAMIKIMKTEKKMAEQELIKEIIVRIRMFSVDIEAVKKQIERLIDRNLLKRDEDDTTMIVYVP